jgi:hypothetical protein
VEQSKEARMSNPFFAEPESSSLSSLGNNRGYAYDDDDEDAVDDEDEDDGLGAPRNDTWFSSAGFGSPEWWSRH